MKLRVDARFDRDLKRIRNADLLRRVDRVIVDIERASAISEIPRIERLTARGNFFRVRVGDYRVGIEVDGDVVTLIRFGHRREIYRRFP